MPAFVLRRNWVWPVFGLLVAGAGYYFGGPIGWWAVMMGTVLGVGTLTRNSFPLARPVMLRTTEQDLEIIKDGALETSIPLDDIAEMKLVPRMDESASTTLTTWNRRGKRLALRLLYANAVSLYEAIGPRRVRFPLLPRLLTRFLWSFAVLGFPITILSMVNAESLLHALLLALVTVCSVVPCALVLALLLGQIRGAATVGADGIRIAWPLRRRFLPWNDVQSIGNDVGCAIVKTTSGRQFRLYARDQPTTQAEVGNERAALMNALLHAHEQHRRRETGEHTLQELVQRGNQDGRQWLATLDRVARGGSTDYRMRAVDPAMLKALAKDAASEIDTRVGAAAALVRLDPSNRVIVRVAAEASADPGVRERLLAVSEALDDVALESALDRRL